MMRNNQALFHLFDSTFYDTWLSFLDGAAISKSRGGYSEIKNTVTVPEYLGTETKVISSSVKKKGCATWCAR